MGVIFMPSFLLKMYLILKIVGLLWKKGTFLHTVPEHHMATSLPWLPDSIWFWLQHNVLSLHQSMDYFIKSITVSREMEIHATQVYVQSRTTLPQTLQQLLQSLGKLWKPRYFKSINRTGALELKHSLVGVEWKGIKQKYWLHKWIIWPKWFELKGAT